MNENDSVFTYYEELNKYLTDTYASKLFYKEAGVKITTSVGEVFGDRWRHGESEESTAEPEKLGVLIKDDLHDFVSQTTEDKRSDGVLRTDIPLLIELSNKMTHVFLTGEESEYFDLIKVFAAAPDKDSQLNLIKEYVKLEKPPPVPVINVEVFFPLFGHLVALVILRDIANEAFNEGHEGDDSAEKAAFLELRSILYSIADSHKCSCGARSETNAVQKGITDDDEIWKLSIAPPDGCKCERGGGFNIEVMCTAIADFIGSGDENDTPVSSQIIADEIFCNQLSDDDSEEDEEDDGFVDVDSDYVTSDDEGEGEGENGED